MIDRRQVLAASVAGAACAAVAAPAWARALAPAVGRRVSIAETFMPREWLAAFSRHMEIRSDRADQAFWARAQDHAPPAAAEGELRLVTLPAPGLEPFSPALARDLARRTNDRLAQAVADSRGAMGGLAALSVFDLRADREAERALSQLGLAGLSLGANRGMRLDDRKLWPVYEVAQAAGAPIYLPAGYSPLAGDAPYRSLNREGVIEGAAAQSRDHAAQLIFGGVIDAFPGLTFVLARLGEAAPYWYRDLVLSQAAYEAAAAPQRDVADYFRSNLYLTTADMTSPGTREFCEIVLGPDRLLASVAPSSGAAFTAQAAAGGVTYAGLRRARTA